jgi:hypothetical protein
MPWISIPTEFVVAATEILDERVPSTDHASRAELRQTPHGSQPRLESSVIGLDRIISVLLNNVTRGRQQLIECPRVGGRPVGAHLSGARTVLKGAGEELAGGRQIPLLGHENIDDLAVLVDRPVQIDPATGNLDVGLIHKPTITCSVPAGSCRIDEQRGEPLHPAVDGDVGQAALIHHAVACTTRRQ